MAWGAVVVGGVQLARLATTIQVGRNVAAATPRFVRRRRGPGPRALVVGDSSAAGTGATSPGTTVAGRLAGRYPELDIGNLARIGSRTHDVAEQLQRLSHRLARRRGAERAPRTADPDEPPQRPYALIVIHTGGNDALHLQSPSAVAAALARALSSATRLADQVVVVTGGNFAHAPGLPVPLSLLWSWWERRLRRALQPVCDRFGAIYVDLYASAHADPTLAAPSRYFAPDGVHPSDANYRLWFRAIDRALRDRGRHVALAGTG